MKKTKSTKRSLLMSALALLMCFSMLIGSTYAWFTDSVTSGNNIIKSGNLDVELEYKKVVNNVLTDWADVAGKDELFDKNALWEPGHTEVVFLKVSNVGTLDLKYQLGVNIVKEEGSTNVYDKEFKLSDYLVFKVLTSDSEFDYTKYDTREEVVAAAGVERGLKDYNGTTTALADGEVDYLALLVYMPTDVDNNANYKKGFDAPYIELGVNLYATQVEAESDSFGPDYDKDAWVDGMKVYDANDLQAAIDGDKPVVLMNDIQATEVVEISDDTQINLNGNQLTANLAVSKDADVEISNGTIVTANDDNSAIETVGNLTLDNVTVNSARHGVRVEGGKTVINGGTYTAQGTAGMTQHALNVSDGGVVIVNGGTFIGPKGTGSDSGSAVNVQADSTVTINGGDFSGGLNDTLASKGTLTVYGGTFDQDPTKYVAAGYKAVASNGKYVVVANEIDNVVSTADELVTAINNGGVVYIADDIDMANNWTSVKPTREMTILGNGNTITNLNLPLLAGNVSTKVTINGLTVADSTVAPAAFENGLGSAAFIPYVDAYGNVTLEDCHIKNSTISGNERAGGLVGYTSGQSLTIKNCSVENCEISAVGGAAGLVAYSQAVTTIENSSVKNSKLTATEDREGSTALAGAVIGTVNADTTLTNVTVSGNTVSNNNAKAVFNDCIGRKVSGKLTIDGNVQKSAATQDELNSAIAGGNVDVTLANGTYKMPSSTTTGNVTITGTKDTVLDVTKGAYMDKANVTIEGVTIKTSTGYVMDDNGNKGSDYAALYSPNTTYVDCTFVGPMRVGRDGAKFINCNFTELGNDYVWTDGNDVTFEGCTFDTDGKAILIYSDGGNEISQVVVKDCTFNATTGAKAGAIANQNCAAIEIHNYGNGVNLTTSGNTYDNNFSGEWRIKTYEEGKPGITVNGVEYTTIAIDGKSMTIDGNKNVTVQ